MFLFNLFGFLLHLGAGVVEVQAAREAQANGATGQAPSLALGAITLLTSFLYAVDATWSALDILVRPKE